MKWTSIAAIYLLFWVMSAFVVMPFFVRTAEEEGVTPKPGHAESAPHHFHPWRIVMTTTLVSTTAFGLYYANYVYGWISAESFNVFG